MKKQRRANAVSTVGDFYMVATRNGKCQGNTSLIIKVRFLAINLTLTECSMSLI